VGARASELTNERAEQLMIDHFNLTL